MTVWGLLGFALLLGLLLAVLSRFFWRLTVFEYQHALRFVRGKFVGVLPPGAHWIFSPLTSIQILEARPRIVTIPGQEVISADGVSLKVSLLLEVRVSDPRAATLESASYEQTLYAQAQSALRSAIGEKPIEEVLQSRGTLVERIRREVEPTASSLGLELRSISIKDMMFPGSLKEAFSQAARAKQESQALLERTRGETASLRNLANAARMFENNPNLFQLRVLQAVSDAGKVVLTIAPPEGNAAKSTSEPVA
jgi:regulator of protease activity HflC (stomatin/prohibitin superfamily)